MSPVRPLCLYPYRGRIGRLVCLLSLVLCVSGCSDQKLDQFCDAIFRLSMPPSADIPGTYLASNGSTTGMLILSKDHTFIETVTYGDTKLTVVGTWTEERRGATVEIHRSDSILPPVGKPGLTKAGGLSLSSVTKLPLPFSSTKMDWNEDIGLTYVRQ